MFWSGMERYWILSRIVMKKHNVLIVAYSKYSDCCEYPHERLETLTSSLLLWSNNTWWKGIMTQEGTVTQNDAQLSFIWGGFSQLPFLNCHEWMIVFSSSDCFFVLLCIAVFPCVFLEKSHFERLHTHFYNIQHCLQLVEVHLLWCVCYSACSLPLCGV